MSGVGLDIGSENCCIAVVKSGGIEVLDNEFNQRSTPSYIGFTNKGRDIGVQARTRLITNLGNTVFGFKRILGENRSDELENEMKYLPYDLCDLRSGNKGIKVNYLRNTIAFSVEQLMAMLITKLKQITESKLGNQIRDCVIAVPVYYTDSQRRAMLDAVNIAGLNAVKLMNEASAIALLYGFKDPISGEESRNVIFVDFGKSCLTVTACEFTKDKVKILGHVWDHVGGRDFDNKLAQYFINDFKERYNFDVSTNKKALMTLILECEELKKVMSANSLEVNLPIECLMNDIDVNGKMKRELFEELCEEILSQIEWNFYLLLRKTGLQPSDIHSVEIVGGSSRIPAVKKLVKKVFDRHPNETLNQDEAVARGCALQCAMLLPSFKKSRDYVLHDIPSFNIHIFWKNKESYEISYKLFSFDDKMPSSKLITTYVGEPFFIEAFATNAETGEKLHEIGTFIFGNIPEDAEKNGFMKMKIMASLNAHGIFGIKYAYMMKVDEESEQNDEQIVHVINTNADMPMDENEKISSPEQLEQNMQMSCAVKSHKLTVLQVYLRSAVSEVSGLTEYRLNEYINNEKELIRKDVEEKEKSDARNVLEEFVYDFRRRLNDELEEFVLEKDKNELLQKLNETENWFEENEELEAAEFNQKFKDLRILFDPILLKCTEWEQRQFLVGDYRRALQQGFDAYKDYVSKLCSDEELEDLGGTYQTYKEADNFLNAYVERVSRLKKVDEIPITVNELRASLETFKSKFFELFVKLQKKYNTGQKNRTSTGDRLSENMET